MSPVSLQEHLEALIAAERELREVTAKDMAQALVIQATEYERRLSILNGEHARMAELTRTFLSREVFDAYMADRGKWDELQDQRIADIERGNVQRFWLLVCIVVVAAVGLAVYSQQMLLQHIVGKVP